MKLERVFFLIVITDIASVVVTEGKRLKDPCKCGVENGQKSLIPIIGKFGELIIKGNEVFPPYKYPWMAAVIRGGMNACGAALISRDYVISAAHCIERGELQGYVNSQECYDQANSVTKCVYEAKELEVAFVTKTQSMSKYYKVSEVIVHPDYKIDDFGNDLVLLKLQRSIKCSRMRRPICLPERGSEIKLGTKVIAAGWGNYQPGGEGDKSKKLLHALLKIISSKSCRQKTMVQVQKKSSICAIGVKDQTLCFGDSGSPIFTNKGEGHYLIAVVSAIATEECETNLPSFMTPIPNNMEWISKYVNEGK